MKGKKAKELRKQARDNTPFGLSAAKLYKQLKTKYKNEKGNKLLRTQDVQR